MAYTLVELGQKYAAHQISDKDLLEEAKQIKLFIPKNTPDDNPEDIIWSNGNGNSWTELQNELVDTEIMRLSEYSRFYKIVNGLQNNQELIRRAN